MEPRTHIVFSIDRHLLKNEGVHWTGSPVRRYFLKYVLSQDPTRVMGYFWFFFGLVFAIFPLLVFGLMPSPESPKHEPPLLIFSAFGLFFAGIGYSFSFARSRQARRLFENTVYYLTAKRAIIISGAEDPTVTCIDLATIPKVSLSLVGGAIGNITFGESDPSIRKGLSRFFDMASWWRGERTRVDGFIAIYDAEEVMRRIGEIKEGTV